VQVWDCSILADVTDKLSLNVVTNVPFCVACYPKIAMPASMHLEHPWLRLERAMEKLEIDFDNSVQFYVTAGVGHNRFIPHLSLQRQFRLTCISSLIFKHL